MRIEKLSLQQIAVFEDSLIEFPPCPEKDKAEIHIFTGPNGSGKSTILQSLICWDNVSHIKDMETFELRYRYERKVLKIK